MIIWLLLLLLCDYDSGIITMQENLTEGVEQ